MSALLASVVASVFLAAPTVQAENPVPADNGVQTESGQQADNMPADSMQADSGNGGWYAGGSAGISFDDEVTFDVFNSSVNRSGTVFLEHGSGASFTLMAGYKLDNNIRLEGSFVWIPLQINDVNYTQLALPQETLDMFASLDDIVQGAGTMTYRGAVFNVLYDIDTGTNWVPYFGGGAGLISLAVDTQVTVLGETFLGSGSGIAEIIQLQAGLGYDFSPQVAVFTNYRWASIGDSSIANYAGTAENPSTLDLDSYRFSSWLVGLKVNFGKR